MSGDELQCFEAGASNAKATKGGSAATVGGAAAGCALAAIHVQVECEGGPPEPPFTCSVGVDGAGSCRPGSAAVGAVAEFAGLDPGSYDVWAQPPAEVPYSFQESVTCSVGAGETKTVQLKLLKAKLAKVTPAAAVEQYVNLDPSDKQPCHGREVVAEAHLSTPLAGVRVHFALAPGAKNASGVTGGSEASIEESALTDAKGVARAKVKLSLVGGDEFQVKAGLCKKLEHPAADTKTSQKITVWRKLWYQLTKLDGFAAPQPGSSVTAWEKVFVRFTKGTCVDFKKADIPAEAQGTSFYSEWQTKVGGGAGTVAVIGAHNKQHFFALFKDVPEEPLKAHLVVCEYQWDPFGTTAAKTKQITTGRTVDLTFTEARARIIKPALKGDLVVTGSWSVVGDATKTGALTDADVSLVKPRASLAQVRVTLPAACPAPTAAKPVEVQLSVRYAKSYLGESSGSKILVVYDASNVADYNDTITHEVGHSLNQTPESGEQPGWMAAHPHQYDDVHGGQGSHCSTRADGTKGVLVATAAGETTSDGRAITQVYQTGVCVMFHKYDATCIHRFCDTCAPYLRAQDMSSWS